jgi:hypothetical protein
VTAEEARKEGIDNTAKGKGISSDHIRHHCLSLLWIAATLAISLDSEFALIPLMPLDGTRKHDGHLEDGKQKRRRRQQE